MNRNMYDEEKNIPKHGPIWEFIDIETTQNIVML